MGIYFVNAVNVLYIYPAFYAIFTHRATRLRIFNQTASKEHKKDKYKQGYK